MLTKQKVILETENTSKLKSEKKRRSKKQIDSVKANGSRLAMIVGAIITLGSTTWKVKSETVRGLQYVVTLSSLGLVCECDANAGGKMICKHVFGVHKILEAKWWNKRVRKKTKIKRQQTRCRNSKCPSEHIVRNGRRKCKKRGMVQRYLCKSCGKTFSGIAGFAGRHYDSSIIIRTLSLVAAKMSPDEVRKQLKNEDVYIHESTIHRWVECYSGLMRKYADTLRVDAGHQWHVDEIFFKILKMDRYLFAVMDGASRFVLSYDISTNKKGCDPTGLFELAANRAFRLPRILVSDGLQEFIKPAKKVFGRMRGPRFVHIREIHLKNIFNQNNISESLNGEFKDRLKCMRGLKSKDPALIHLMIIYHNFFREHESLKHNMTPAQAIGIDIVPPVSDSTHSPECNRWITFIENSAIHATTATA